VAPISASNLIFHELIGLWVTVVESSDPTLKGLEGEIVDETKNMFKLRTRSGYKALSKSAVTLRVKLPDSSTVVEEGRRLVGRPEDRLRRMMRRR